MLIARPGQSVAQVRATVAYAHRLGVQVRPAQFSPIPGTQEWEVGARWVRALGDDADPLLHNNSLYPCGGTGGASDAVAWEELKVQMGEGNRALIAP